MHPLLGPNIACMMGVCSVLSSESCYIPLQAVIADKQAEPEVIGSAEFGVPKCDIPVLERLSQLNLAVSYGTLCSFLRT